MDYQAVDENSISSYVFAVCLTKSRTGSCGQQPWICFFFNVIVLQLGWKSRQQQSPRHSCWQCLLVGSAGRSVSHWSLALWRRHHLGVDRRNAWQETKDPAATDLHSCRMECTMHIAHTDRRCNYVQCAMQWAAFIDRFLLQKLNSRTVADVMLE